MCPHSVLEYAFIHSHTRLIPNSSLPPPTRHREKRGDGAAAAGTPPRPTRTTSPTSRGSRRRRGEQGGASLSPRAYTGPSADVAPGTLRKMMERGEDMHRSSRNLESGGTGGRRRGRKSPSKRSGADDGQEEGGGKGSQGLRAALRKSREQ